jgi:hypothetical protein
LGQGLGAKAAPLQRDAAALAIFAALTLVMTNPLVLHIASAVEDRQDALLNTWIIAWVGHALITGPFNLFNSNIFYPYANTLAFSETMLPQGIFALPFNLAIENTVLGYNLVLLASFLLAAYGMYLLVFDLTRRRDAAIIAGTVFAFNPYNLGNLAQVQLLSFGWLPLAIMYLKRVLGKPEGKGSDSKFALGPASDTTGIHNLPNRFRIPNFEFRICFLFAFFFSLQCLSSFYYAFLAGIAVFIYIALHIPTFQPLHLILSRFIVVFAFVAVLVTPFFAPYFKVQRDLGFERQVEESEPFSASLQLYAEVSPQNVLYGGWLGPRTLIYNGGYPLDNLFPGVIAFALAIVGVTAARNKERWFYLVLLALALLFSLGPRLYLAPTQPTILTLPYRWLYDLLPLMRALRAPVRFDALVMFALAVLAGLGAARIWNSKLPFTIYRLPITDFLIPLIALEYVALPAAQITPVPVDDAIPEYVRWLEEQPPGVVLELPMIASDPTKPLDLTTQYLSTYHWHPSPDGYSGFIPPRRGEIAYEMQSFPSDRSISLLQALDVRYLVVHKDPMVAPRALASELQLHDQFSNEQVYSVVPRAQDASALFTLLYVPQPAAPDRNFVAYVIVENRSARSFAIKPTTTFSVQAMWNGQTALQTSARLPLVTSGVTTESGISIMPVELLAPSSLGDYRLELKIRSDVTGEWDMSSSVAVRDEELPRQVVLPVRVTLARPLNSLYMSGEQITVALAWVPLSKVDAYYSASVRVVDAQGRKIVAVDRQPFETTLLWAPDAPVPDQFTLTLPPDLAAGEYSVQVLMYQADQGINALLLDDRYVPQQSIILGEFAVK